MKLHQYHAAPPSPDALVDGAPRPRHAEPRLSKQLHGVRSRRRGQRGFQRAAFPLQQLSLPAQRLQGGGRLGAKQGREKKGRDGCGQVEGKWRVG